MHTTTRLLLITLVTGLTTSRSLRANEADEFVFPGPVAVYRARAFDDDGRLEEALPLYAAAAEQTATQGDRLRLASALLRAERTDEARAVLDRLSGEAGSIEHGQSGEARSAAVAASTAIRAGRPAVAAVYARAAVAAEPAAVGKKLLLARALAAAGETKEARELVRAIAKDPGALGDAERLELARVEIAVGDVAPARARLAKAPAEAIGQMYQESVRANLDLAAGDWPAAAARLESAERLTPKGLAQGRVDQAWRNAQRELHVVKLRRALALWRDGRHEKAVDLATLAKASDEEYVRAAATLLLAAADLRGGRRPEALARLRVLRGHDVRYGEATRAFEAAVAEDRDPAPAVDRVREALGGADRSLEFVTAAVADALLGAATASGSRMAASEEMPSR